MAMAPLAAAQTEVRAFTAAFRTPKDISESALTARADALRAVATIDNAALADAALDAWARADHALSAVERLRRPALTKPSEEATERLFALRDRLDPLLLQYIALEDLVRRLRDDDARQVLITRMILGQGLTAHQRIVIAEQHGSAAAGAEILSIQKLFERARSSAERTILSRAAQRIGARGAAALVTPLLTILEGNDPALRIEAAHALGSTRSVRAVTPLINALEHLDEATDRSTVRERRAIGEALDELTGQTLGTLTGSWRIWLEDHREIIEGGRIPTPPVKPPKTPDTLAKTSTYFGIPQDGDSLLYVIDVSGSMRSPMTSLGGARSSRIATVRKEFASAIQSLPLEKRFDVVLFSTAARRLFRKPQPATTASKARAIDFVAQATADGATNLFDALELSLATAGRHAGSEWFETEADTVFVMSDGDPTRPQGGFDSNRMILAATDRWNPAERVVIHGIALGQDRKLLEQLAARNRGVYVRR